MHQLNALTEEKVEFHPLMMAFPCLRKSQMESLIEDIRTRGSPVILRRGEVILGDFNVYNACKLAGVKLHFKEWDGTGSLAEVIARSVLPAAQFDASQRAAMAVAISDQVAAETMASGIAGGRANLKNSGNAKKTAIPANGSVAAHNAATESDEEKTRGRAGEIAADLFQVSARYVYEARKLRDEARELFELVKLGQMNLSKARVQAGKLTRAKSLVPPLNGKPAKRSQGDDELIVGDCLEKMYRMPDGAFPFIFADPPYNNGWKYDGDQTGDLLPEAKYLDWCDRWIKQCARLLTPDGSIFILIDSRWQGRFDVLLRNATLGGLHHRNTIVWHDPFPIHTEARFQPSARFLHYFTRSNKKFTWNADPVRVPSRRDEIEDARRWHDKGMVPHDVWDCPRVVGSSKDRVPFEEAPPQVPSLILERIIIASSNPGDRVFDPFTGNGTTWRAARKLGRKFTGIERSKKYAVQARQWAGAE